MITEKSSKSDLLETLGDTLEVLEDQEQLLRTNEQEKQILCYLLIGSVVWNYFF